MFDLGMGELLIIGTVGLIVIGPRDLPEVFRQMGRFTAKARQMGREFSRAMEQAADEAGVKDVASDLNKIANPKSMGVSAMKDAVDRFEKWDPMSNAATPTEPLSASSITADEEEDFSGGAFDEAAANIAESAAPEHGPETQALIDKQAARKAVIDESTAKLKAIDAGEAAAKPAAKPRKSRSSAKTTTAKGASTKTARSKTAAAGKATTAKSASAKSTAGKTATSKTATSKAAAGTTAAKTTSAKKGAAKTDKPAAAKPASKPASRARKTPSSTAES